MHLLNVRRLVFLAAVVLGFLLSGCATEGLSPISIELDESWSAKYAAAVESNATGVVLHDEKLYICQNSDLAYIKIDLQTGKVSDMPSDFLKAPHGLKYYNGFLWIADVETNQVYKTTLEGKLVASYGKRYVSGADGEHFYKPTDVAVAANGNIYVADGYGNRRIVCLDKDGKFLFQWGKQGTGEGEFNNPHNILIHNDNVYLADRDNDRVQVFDMKGNFIRQIEGYGKIFGIYIHDDKLFISRTTPEKHSVLITDLYGNLLAEYGSLGDKLGQFDVPHTITTDGNSIYVVEVNNQRVQKLVIK